MDGGVLRYHRGRPDAMVKSCEDRFLAGDETVVASNWRTSSRGVKMFALLLLDLAYLKSFFLLGICGAGIPADVAHLFLGVVLLGPALLALSERMPLNP